MYDVELGFFRSHTRPEARSLGNCAPQEQAQQQRGQGEQPGAEAAPAGLVHRLGPSPLELAIGAENIERYEAAVDRLSQADREAIIGRLELQYSYDQLAVALGKSSPDAARMAVTRALKRLAEEMRRGR